MKNEKMRQEQTGSVCKLAQNNLRKIDTEAIKLHIRGILQALGDDPDREGLKETPERVAKMYEEVFEGMCYSNQEIADMFRKNFAQDSTENSQDMVLVKNIEIFSYCEHHLALMYDMKVSVAYIPRGNVLGLSKIARIADMVGKRLQLQERIGSDIAEIMELVTNSHDVAVMIDQEDKCGHDNNDTSRPIQDGSNAADEFVSAASGRPIKHRKENKEGIEQWRKIKR